MQEEFFPACVSRGFTEGGDARNSSVPMTKEAIKATVSFGGSHLICEVESGGALGGLCRRASDIFRFRKRLAKNFVEGGDCVGAQIPNSPLSPCGLTTFSSIQLVQPFHTRCGSGIV